MVKKPDFLYASATNRHYVVRLCPSVSACIRVSVLLTRYLRTQWTEFRQALLMMYTVSQKRDPDIISCNLKKD